MKRLRPSISCLTLVMAVGFIFLLYGIAGAKAYDLVLVHGFLNYHKWSEELLDECLKTYGSGKVYAIYLDGSSDLGARTINGRTLICAGRDSRKAGTEHVATQAAYMTDLIAKLQSVKGLRSPFSIIAHSMGGLVARQYAYEHPGKVADIVCLGTPNHGSQLADVLGWTAFFTRSRNAMHDLSPGFVDGTFNNNYPVRGIKFAGSGRLYTIRGNFSGCNSCGSGPIICELVSGYWVLKNIYNYENDGMVPDYSVLITGGVPIADYAHYDHLDLIRKKEVAAKAMSVLR
ncbi:MAG: hypothetical protein A2W19_06245 [Spirochaetes bacterium RBG_16_49_21]|nr:MAG: hypothetical protein A2W19_06245 [Spirochaetes bacterium RBG_16_49_21]